MTASRPTSSRGVRRTAIACAGLAFGMIGLAFASVPLYDAFCKAKYTADDLKDMKSKGQAMAPSSEGGDPSYPIKDAEDTEALSA